MLSTTRILVIVGTVAVLSGFQNCSDVSFDQDKGSGASQNATGPDEVGGGVGQNGGTNTGVVATGGPGGTTNPRPIPVGFPLPPIGVTDAPPAPPPGSTFPPGVTVVPPGTPLPRIITVEPPCIRGQWCAYELQLDKAYPLVVDFDWKTNDDPNKPAPVRQGTIRGVPDVHYLPGSGHVTFLPGETKRLIYVLNINPDPTLGITIPFSFTACKYGRAAASCVAMFPASP